MAMYPGGTVWDPQSKGYDLLRNYLCDLLAPEALNGAENGLLLLVLLSDVVLRALLLPVVPFAADAHTARRDDEEQPKADAADDVREAEPAIGRWQWLKVVQG